MGQTESYFTKAELEIYRELTYLSKKEIVNIYKRFLDLDAEKIGKDRDAKIPMETVMTIPELCVNPFKDRFCLVFSSSKDGSLTFEDFLDMMSAFNEKAPLIVKVEYTFRIYDFDGDDLLSVDDLKEVINRLTGEDTLADEYMTTLLENIFSEADLDDDDTLSFAEFQHIISKCPDFSYAFHLRL